MSFALTCVTLLTATSLSGVDAEGDGLGVITVSRESTRVTTTDARGFAVYGVGPNGRDDGGRGWEDVPDGSDAAWDDIVVRVRR